MISSALMPLLGNSTLPTWLREILASVGIAARAITVFAAAVAFGILVAVKIGEGNPWVAAAAAVSVLLFVVLPVRLWLSSRVPQPGSPTVEARCPVGQMPD
jgi:hypothetical protein